MDLRLRLIQPIRFMKARIVSLSLLSLLLTGCAQSIAWLNSPIPPAQPLQPQPAKVTDLAGTYWTLSVLEGQAIVPSSTGWAAPGLEFSADGQSAVGFSGVNRFSGRYTQDGAALEFGPLAMTRRAGPPDLMQTESRFTRILSGVTGWRQRGANIELIAANQVGAVLAPISVKK
jgi:heat shock protein HslJ